MTSNARAPSTGDRGERRQTAEDVAARALLEATTIDEAAPRILQGICDALGWEHGALWTIDREAAALRCTEIWTAPSVTLPEFNAISRMTRFPRGVGLPGRVWASGEPAWIPDVVRDSNFPRAAVAAREGLHAAFGFPVLLRGEVLSVLEFFSREIREPDAYLLSMLTTVGSQIGMFIDRRRAQEELDRFFTLSLDMLCVAGFDGYFKRVNPAWTRILGYTEAELLSRPYMELIHPDDRAATVVEANKLNEGQDVIYFENRYFHKDGTVRWLLWTAAPFREQQMVYAVARDITERKEAEETLAGYARDLRTTHTELEDQAARLAQLVKELETAKRRAEEATETKSAFLANMSHEIRTPLNAILGMTTLALGTRLSAEQQDYLTTVKSSAESLLDIVNDILDFSKIEAHRLDLDHAEFDVRETVGDAAKVLALRAAEKGIELAYEVAPDVPAALEGDAGRLRQVLLNVLGNAVKFTADGEVVLRVTVEDALPERPTLRFTVTDTGIGIPPDKLDDIFQAFTQADSSTTRRYGGTGLGLAIALRLVELMGGRLWVESEVGRGSTFHFTAVLGRPAAPAIVPAYEGPKALEGLRVLVVDDNATNRRILEEMLVSWHMRPTAVSDAAGAIALLQQASPSERYHVVISDCQMPDVDGFALARRIKHDQHLRATPVVMLTSVGRADDAARVRRLGIDAYLTKPVKHSDLLDALATLFGGSVRRDRTASLAHAPSPAPQRLLRILVAEDHPVNRKLVTTLLRKRGHKVEAVDNGRAAVASVHAAKPRPFDVVIMDVQMPEMSGFEAAEAIRTAERTTGRHLPIVALTAHAMQGDRERCLEAGMDGYLSKPIDVDQLIATVEDFGGAGDARKDAGDSRRGGLQPALGRLKPAPTTEDGSAPTDHRRSPTEEGRYPIALVFDEQAALLHTGGDRQLLKQIIALFRADCPGSLRKIERALRRRDGEALWTAAHALKGSIATVGARAARQTVAELEQSGRAREFDLSARAYARLRDQVTRLNDAFVDAGLVSRSRRPAPRRPRRPRRAKRAGRAKRSRS